MAVAQHVNRDAAGRCPLSVFVRLAVKVIFGDCVEFHGLKIPSESPPDFSKKGEDKTITSGFPEKQTVFA